MRFTAICVIAASLLFFAPAFSQVSNNEIDQRVELVVNQLPYSSNTVHSTVEPDCIDKALTAACLVYHNDQWFTFTVPADGRYYLNVGEQDCREKRGIQILLIEGDPCVIPSYEVRRCIPKLDLKDTYVILDSLRKDVRYLLNIDGFLGDDCYFTLQVADHARGFPEQDSYGSSMAEVELKDSIVTIHFRLESGGADQVSKIRIYRKYQYDEDSLIASIHSGRVNSLGSYQSVYTFNDTTLVRLTGDHQGDYQLSFPTPGSGFSIVRKTGQVVKNPTTAESKGGP